VTAAVVTAAVVTASGVTAAVVTGAGIVVTMVMGAISTGTRKSEAELLVGTGGRDRDTEAAAAVDLGLIFLAFVSTGGGTEACTTTSADFAGVEIPLERAVS
jgi:hypothetical protein